MITVVETLKYIRDPVLLGRYRRVFQDFDNLRRQRNVLTHEYGREGGDMVDWPKVWETIVEKYPNLEAAIEDAIKDIKETRRRLKAAETISKPDCDFATRHPDICSTRSLVGTNVENLGCKERDQMPSHGGG